ncbi:MAG TPA: hypothetical protein VGL92_10975, partial [Acidimicrobiia bacterium]
MSNSGTADGGARLHVAASSGGDQEGAGPAPTPPPGRRVVLIVLLVGVVSVVIGVMAGSNFGPDTPSSGPGSATPGGTAGARPVPAREGGTSERGSGRVETAAPGGRTWYVSADGATGADGSHDRPFGSIDLAVAEARAGDTVMVGPGTYPGFSTTRSGRPDAPVRIVGSAAV